jgi:hypothetical protein
VKNYFLNSKNDPIMRKILSLMAILGALNVASGQQACTPIASFIDSPSAVQPWPYDSLLFPTGGIKKVACIGKAFDFTFTIRLKDTIVVNFLGSATPLPIDSIKLNAGSGVTGLPAGLTYACFPASCVFKKNSLGCVVIKGTPAASNTPKIYPLAIVGKAYSPFLPTPVDLSIPSSAFPGKYDLKLVAAGSTECTSGVGELSDRIVAMKNVPNPFTGSTNIQITALTGGTYQFSVHNSLGRKVYEKPVTLEIGENNIPFQAEYLQSGLYFYSLARENSVITSKMVVNR